MVNPPPGLDVIPQLFEVVFRKQHSTTPLIRFPWDMGHGLGLGLGLGTWAMGHGLE